MDIEAVHSEKPEIAAPSQAEDELSSTYLLDLLIKLAEHKRIIFLIAAISTVLAIVFSLFVPSRYTATVVVLPPQQNQSMSSVLASQLNSTLGGVSALAGGSMGLKNPNEMIVSMFRSRTVEDSMIKRFDLMKLYNKHNMTDTRAAFEKRAIIEAGAKDSLIRINFEDRDPRRAAEIANAYVDEFRKLSQTLAITEASQRRLFFEQQLRETKDNLANAENALRTTQQQTGLIELDSQTKALIQTAASLRAQIVMKEMQVQGIRTYATGENAELVGAQQELNSLRGQLAALGGSEESPESIIVPRGKVTQAGIEYARKLRDVKYYDTIFEILSKQYESAKLDEAKQGALIQVIDPAIPPDKRSFPKRSILTLGGCIVGIVLGVLYVLVLVGLQRIRNDAELSLKFSLLRQLLLTGRSR